MIMKMQGKTLGAVLVLSMLLAAPAQAVQRAYVSAVSGNDANTATGCPATAPCRWFATAVTVVDAGGEVVAMDTGAYGSVTLTNSISLISAPGAYAGISVFPSSTGVNIATGGINVTLRGLTINGMGGNYGVNMTNGARLSIENCVISNFGSGATGVNVASGANVRVVDTLVRDNSVGVALSGGATADISGSKFLGNANGIYVQGTGANSTTASVSDTVVSGASNTGIWAYASNASATVRVEVIRGTVANGNYGVSSTATAGTALLTLSDSMVSGNSTGLYQNGAGASLKSLGNNTVSDNTTASSGTITPLAAM
jgi:anti-sigma28 factor (negative regulator of flagellin synthesis)